MDAGNSRQVSVSVRVRPKLENAVNEIHRTERYERVACTAISDTTLRLWDGKLGKDSRSVHFCFDNVFGTDTPQADMYEAAAVDAVDAALRGTNASILTYGQTGSGKTYTVLGGIQNNPLTNDIVTEDTGVLMRAVEELLHYAEQMRARKKRHVVLGISVVEIYLEEVRDLLNPRSTQGTVVNAAMMKDVVRLPGLTCAPLETLSDAMEVYQRAAARRVQRATSANDTSSRSHAVFTIEMFQTPFGAHAPSLQECLRARDAYITATLDPQQRAVKPVLCAEFDGAANPLLGSAMVPLMYSKLTVADLAGSEKAKHSDVRGEGFEELRKINSSLTALGNVVHSLHEGARHIPYRDSKLTLVLRDAFASPGARISLIVNVSPTALTFEESLSSLYFADKVKAVKVRSAASAQDAAAEEAFLAALRKHDAVLADLHIFACEQERRGCAASFLPHAAALMGDKNPLLRAATRTAVPASRAKTAAMTALCESLRRERATNDAASRMARLLKEQHRQSKEEALAEYLHARRAVRAELKEVVAAVEALRSEEKDREAAMVATLEVEHAAYTKAHTERQALDKRRREVAAAQEKTHKFAMQLSTQMQTLASALGEDPRLLSCHHSQEDAREQAQETVWAVLKAHGPQAVEVAQLRERWVALYTENRSTAPRGTRTSKSMSPSSSASADPETWLRHAVLAMAGNAVVQSMRRTHPRRGTASSPGQHTDPRLLGSVDPNRPHKYWTQKRLIEEEQKRRPLRHSAFDDPRLGETIAAFMDMGSPVRRLGSDGKLHERLFFVVERHGRKRLCWDDPSHDKQQALRLGSMGHIELCHVTRIILGQGTPSFLKCKANESFFTSFSLEYRSSSSSRSKKYLDVVCSSVREMETWVIGLSQASGVYPRYVGTSQPDSLDADTAGGAPPVEAELTPAALRLTQEWHVPVSTLVEALAQVNVRRMKHASQRMAITPGELADVTKLDVFRGSALWLHLQHEGLVENPGKRLFCFIEYNESGTSAGTSPTGASAGVSDSPHESSKERSVSQPSAAAVASA